MKSQEQIALDRIANNFIGISFNLLSQAEMNTVKILIEMNIVKIKINKECDSEIAWV